MYIYFLFLIIVFFLGMYFYVVANVEGFSTAPDISCPTLLVQEGNQIVLYNSNNNAEPIRFKNLEEYTEFVDWQRSQGIKCPVLFLKRGYNAQGTAVYNIRPSPTDLQGGLPPTIVTDTSQPVKMLDATVDNPPFNSNMYPAFDKTNLHSADKTELDTVDVAKEQWKMSDNPMDTNWGGGAFSVKMVDIGYYQDNYVYRLKGGEPSPEMK